MTDAPDQHSGAGPDESGEERRQRESDDLRRAAEESLDEILFAAITAAAAASPPLPVPEKLTAAVHELRVHQIELEMQNEELRRAQLELDEQRGKYFELFDLAPVGYLTLSAEGMIKEANLTAARLLGVERRLLVGRPFTAFVSALDRDLFYQLTRALRQTGEPQSCELRLWRAGGGADGEAGTDARGGAGGGAAPAHFWAHLEGRPETSSPDEPLGYRVTFTDVDERRQAQDALAALNDELEDRVLARTAELGATNRELEAFVYSVSHDLRAPLRAIDGFSAMIAEDAADRLDADDVEHLQRVRAAAQRMGLLIDHLLALSRAARKDLLFEPVAVSAIAVSVLADLRSQAPERNVETLVAPGMTALADGTMVRAVLANLLDNAWKFTGGHGSARIEVGVVDADGERAFYVKDDGIGFDSAHAEHLFGAFQRLHTAEEFEGDGIGLATVQRLVRRHGGRVWAKAEPEKGATFFFTLPGPAAAH